MKNILLLLIHLLTIVGKLLGRGGIKGIIADNLLLEQQLRERRAITLGYCSR